MTRIQHRLLLLLAVLGAALPAAVSAANPEPVVYLVCTSDIHSIPELSDFVSSQIRDRLQNLPGVAAVSVLGERRFALQIRIDPIRLEAYGLSRRDVETALSGLTIPGTAVNKNDVIEYVLPSLGTAPSPEALDKVEIKRAGDVPVRLSDVATVHIGTEEERRVVTYQGKRAVALGLIPQSWLLKPAVLLNLRAAMPQIRAELPRGITVEAAYGASLEIK